MRTCVIDLIVFFMAIGLVFRSEITKKAKYQGIKKPRSLIRVFGEVLQGIWVLSFLAVEELIVDNTDTFFIEIKVFN